MKKIYFLLNIFFLTGIFSFCYSQSTSTTSDLGTGVEGDWNDAASWSGGIPQPDMYITIEAGETIFVNKNTSVGAISDAPVHLIIKGVLRFDQAGKLTLPFGSTITIEDGGDIQVPNSGNNSTLLGIGDQEIRGSDLDAIEGPAYLDENNLAEGGEPLPVNLLYFSATPQQNAVKLDWASSKAWDFSHYELERSADGITFNYLATIDAEENANWTVNFSFTDDQPLNGNSYYRLKAVDIDGAFEYKGIEVVQFAARASLKAYPNPATNGTLHVQQNDEAAARVSLKDNSGRTVYTGTMLAAAKTIDTSSLPSGLYVLIVEGASGVQKKHIIIQ